ncbi:MAG: hypothetical protein H6Q23_1517, partial [Bacteroidetes bacterium]|nr:hypothetical protein [Bacteroidota bacterium]
HIAKTVRQKTNNPVVKRDLYNTNGREPDLVNVKLHPI